MTNTSTTQAPAPTTPANAVTQNQAIDMLTGMGLYLEQVHAALYRLQLRTSTLLTQGALTLRCERLAADVFVITVAA